jgi:sugar/nucleoside kinase (ribokinase family)
MNRQWDVLGLGCVAVDDLLYVEAFPAPDSKVRVNRRERQCGGLSGTALVAAARLGARCAYAGTLGEDANSLFVMETFAREGIDLQPLLRRTDARPIHSTIIVDQRLLTRTILFDLTGSVGAGVDHPPEEVIRSSRVLYVDHYGIEGMTRAARIARNAGIAVVADLERDEWPGFHGLLDLVDHLIVHQQFAEKLTGETEPAAVLNRLWRPDRQVVVVTCGAAGCWYRDAQGEPRHQPAFAVTAVDPTGCGDVFHGAYAAALAHGMGIFERIRFASAAAALKARQYGGQAGIPTLAEVRTFLGEREAPGTPR